MARPRKDPGPSPVHGGRGPGDRRAAEQPGLAGARGANRRSRGGGAHDRVRARRSGTWRGLSPVRILIG